MSSGFSGKLLTGHPAPQEEQNPQARPEQLRDCFPTKSSFYFAVAASVACFRNSGV